MRAYGFHCFLIVLAAGTLLATSPYTASDLSIVPDSVEYAIGAHNIATTGDYFISIGGVKLPPRYPPWFSLLFLSPIYTLAPNDPGMGIIAITGMALMGIIAAFYIGRTVSGNMGGLFASVALLSIPMYREYSGHIMTDVPCAAMCLLMAALYILANRTNPQHRLRVYALAGLVCAICASLRPVTACFLTPFLFIIINRPRSSVLKKAFLLLLPLTVLAAATMSYNARMFGSGTRNGYQFWCPVPYDYPNMTFSLRYVADNMLALLETVVVPTAVACLALLLLSNRFCRTKDDAGRATIRSLLLFAAITAAPLIFFHQIYFFPDPRFYLPVAALLATICGSLAGRLVQGTPGAIVAAEMVIVGIAIALRIATPQTHPTQRMMTDSINRHTPTNAVIVSSINPVYMEFMTARGAVRTIIPLSRNVEYASKAVAVRPLGNLNPAPKDWRDHRCAGLMNAGAEDVVPIVAADALNFLARSSQSGKPVYLDTSRIIQADRDILVRIQHAFDMIPVEDHLYHMIPKNNH